MNREREDSWLPSQEQLLRGATCLRSFHGLRGCYWVLSRGRGSGGCGHGLFSGILARLPAHNTSIDMLLEKFRIAFRKRYKIVHSKRACFSLPTWKHSARIA